MPAEGKDMVDRIVLAEVVDMQSPYEDIAVGFAPWGSIYSKWDHEVAGRARASTSSGPDEKHAGLRQRFEVDETSFEGRLAQVVDHGATRWAEVGPIPASSGLEVAVCRFSTPDSGSDADSDVGMVHSSDFPSSPFHFG